MIEADFGHLGTKSIAGIGPVDTRRKVFLGDAFLLPLALVRFLPLPLYTSHGPFRSGRWCNLGGKVNVRDTSALQGRDQRGGLEGNERVDLPFVGLSPRYSPVAYMMVGVATLLRMVSNSHRLDQEAVYSLMSSVRSW